MKRRRFLAGGITRFVQWLTQMSYLRLAFMYGLMIVSFGVAYLLLYLYVPHHGPSIGGGPLSIKFFNAVYFSTITAASVGYGDISPHGLSKIIASAESLLSLFVFAIMVSKPISERQEAALYQMHKLTLDQILTSIREGLFIMRKDFDEIMLNIEKVKTLSSRDIENFETALRQGQVLMGDISSFYDDGRDLYRMDRQRERLVAEAVSRTLERLQKTIDVCHVHDIPLPQSSRSSLGDFVKAVTDILQRWQRHSPEHMRREIGTSLEILKKLI